MIPSSAPFPRNNVANLKKEVANLAKRLGLLDVSSSKLHNQKTSPHAIWLRALLLYESGSDQSDLVHFTSGFWDSHVPHLCEPFRPRQWDAN
jgi:hypothetical protein